MISVFKSPLLEQFTEIRHGFFGRKGGVSTGPQLSLNCGDRDDSAENVKENRRRALACLTHHTLPLTLLNQVHSNLAYFIKDPFPSGQEGDGTVTKTPHLAIGVLTADCAPVLLYCPETRTIAACHAGWKGALGGIIESTVNLMVEKGACREKIVSAVGPCIAQQSYEVSTPFFAEFTTKAPESKTFFQSTQPEKFLFNLRGYVERRLHQAGVQAVDHVAHNTYAEEANFFSFRRKTHRNEPSFGNQLSAIALLSS